MSKKTKKTLKTPKLRNNEEGHLGNNKLKSLTTANYSFDISK